MFERFKWWLTRRSRESTMNDELEAHIACETEDQIARGLDPGAARQAAGHYVPFVLWFNFLAGFAYIVAGVGLWMRRRWAAWPRRCRM